MYTKNMSISSIQTKVVGTTFNGRQCVVAQLEVGEEVYLVREPTNAFDSNAIKVVRQDGTQVGYISRELAASFATLLDHHGDPIKAFVTTLTGGDFVGSSLGVMIRFELPE